MRLICEITYLEILPLYKIKSNLAMHLANQGLSWGERMGLGSPRKSRMGGHSGVPPAFPKPYVNDVYT